MGKVSNSGFVLMFVCWICAPAVAGDISPNGSSIEVETERCEVKGPRTIECINVGRVCQELRAAEKIHDDRTFGCAIEGGKNYPCPKDDNETPEQVRRSAQCWPMLMGAM